MAGLRIYAAVMFLYQFARARRDFLANIGILIHLHIRHNWLFSSQAASKHGYRHGKSRRRQNVAVEQSSNIAASHVIPGMAAEGCDPSFEPQPPIGIVE